MVKNLCRKIEYTFFLKLDSFFKLNGAVILLYHQISEIVLDQMTVAPKIFERQMSYLAENNLKVISLGEYVKLMTQGVVNKDRYVIITFDDGFQGVYEAYRIIRKFGYKFTVFLSTKYVGKGAWLHKSMKQWALERLDSEGVFYPFLTWKQIEEMDEYGIEFGGHTHSHVSLTDIKTPVIGKEIDMCKEELDAHLGKGADWFAYPYGEYDEEAKELVESRGFGVACGVNPGGLNRFSACNFSLVRHNVPNNAGIDFEFTLTPFVKFHHWISPKLNFWRHV